MATQSTRHRLLCGSKKKEVLESISNKKREVKNAKDIFMSNSGILANEGAPGKPERKVVKSGILANGSTGKLKSSKLEKKMAEKPEEKRRKTTQPEMETLRTPESHKSGEEVPDAICLPMPGKHDVRGIDRGILLDEEGDKLVRKLGLTDDNLRKKMVDSITLSQQKMQEAQINAVNALEEEDWVSVNLGRSYVSPSAIHNLLAAVPAVDLGLGTVMVEGGQAYLVNRKKERFNLDRVGNQLRFTVRIVDHAGNCEEMEMVHDSGAAANILKKEHSELWKSIGREKVVMSGYGGGKETLCGGGDLIVMMKKRKEITINQVEQEVLTVKDVIETIALVESVMPVVDNNLVSQEKEKKEYQNPSPSMTDEERAEHEELLERVLSDARPGEKKAVFTKLRSAESIRAQLKRGEEELLKMDGDQLKSKRGRRLAVEFGIMRRMEKMEGYSRMFPHLTMESLNKMVADGDLKDGIEFNAKSKPTDAAKYIAKGTKTRSKKKKKTNDPAIGHRQPCCIVMIDLIDLTEETKGNRWGYNWLLTVTCAECGLKQAYPLVGKMDVEPAWRQFQQYLKVISPYSKAKLGMECRVDIVASDQGPEFTTIRGERRGALDEVLYKDGIARWFATAGDSNALGKIERFNRTLCENMNVSMRRAGCKNIFAYDAATWFVLHYNVSPTTSNIVGNGEAPLKWLGVPIRYDMLVPFFCPGWVKLPNTMMKEEGVKGGQSKLGQKMKRCFVLGYGSGVAEGSDSAGYKIWVDGRAYASKHVKVTPEMTVTQSMLTGMAHDPLNEGILIKRIFDVDGTESLLRKEARTYKEIIAVGPKPTEVVELEPERDDVNDDDNCDDAKQTNGTEVVKPPVDTGIETKGRDNKGKAISEKAKHVGTGVTGQMKSEMRPYEDKLTKNCEMDDSEAASRINDARHKKKLLVFRPPDEAQKRGKSGRRYAKYWKQTTFGGWDEMRRNNRDAATAGDMKNDVRKGHLRFVDDPNIVKVQDEDEELYRDMVFGEAEELDLASEVEPHSVSLVFGMSDEVVESVETINLGTIGEMPNSDKVEVDVDQIHQSEEAETDGEFFKRVVCLAQEELGTMEVPIWKALAVFHQADVWVGDRKQPVSLKEAMRLKEWPEWEEAIRKEIRGLIEVGAWTAIPREEVKPGVKVLPGKMILEIKTENGAFLKCKARYVSRGDLSEKYVHYYESSSHQARAKSLRMLYSTAVERVATTGKTSFIPRNLDIKQAYLQRKRTEEEATMYMELPEKTFGEGPDRASGYVAKMMRHIYGEVDGGRAFERELLEHMDSIGAVATVSDRMVFRWRWNGQVLTALVHVDDIVYNGDGDEILEEFFRRAELKFGTLTGGSVSTDILGIHITWDLEKMTVKLSQRAHAVKFLEAFGFDIEKTKSKDTPMPHNVDMQPNTGRRVPTKDWDYYGWCGNANWLCVMTRPDLCCVTNWCGRFSHNPGEEHVAIQRHALRYLAGTLDEGITYHGRKEVLEEPYDHRNKLIGWVDSNHGVGHDTMCVCIGLNGGPVIFRVWKQRVVTTSTAHSEMIALAAGARELTWASDFMAEIGYEQGTVRVMGDNQSANLQATGDYKSSKSDHYRRVQFYVEDNVRNGLMWIDKVPTDDNIADLGTKQVSPTAKFKTLRDIALGTTPKLTLTRQVKEILAGRYDGTAPSV